MCSCCVVLGSFEADGVFWPQHWIDGPCKPERDELGIMSFTKATSKNGNVECQTGPCPCFSSVCYLPKQNGKKILTQHCHSMGCREKVQKDTLLQPLQDMDLLNNSSTAPLSGCPSLQMAPLLPARHSPHSQQQQPQHWLASVTK